MLGGLVADPFTALDQLRAPLAEWSSLKGRALQRGGFRHGPTRIREWSRMA